MLSDNQAFTSASAMILRGCIHPCLFNKSDTVFRSCSLINSKILRFLQNRRFRHWEILRFVLGFRISCIEIALRIGQIWGEAFCDDCNPPSICTRKDRNTKCRPLMLRKVSKRVRSSATNRLFILVHKPFQPYHALLALDSRLRYSSYTSLIIATIMIINTPPYCYRPSHPVSSLGCICPSAWLLSNAFDAHGEHSLPSHSV